VHATELRVAGVRGAWVVVVTVYKSALALPQVAVVLGGARIRVIARSVVVNMRAALGRVARVVRAQIAVVAVGHPGPHTLAFHAAVPHRTRVVVIARHIRQRLVYATARWITPVGSARIAVVATHLDPARALPVAASLSEGAHVPVVAVTGARGVDAARGRKAGIFGAHVLVVAIHDGPADAVTVEARVIIGAPVAVVAGHGVVLVHATRTGVACVVSARI